MGVFMMKRQILAFVCMFGAVSASGMQQQERRGWKVFDKGMLTSINGNNLYAYLYGRGLHNHYPEFLEIKVFEFTGKEYIDHGTLREIRDQFPDTRLTPSNHGPREFRQKTLPGQQNSRQMSNQKNKNSTSQSAMSKVVTEQNLDAQRNTKLHRMIYDHTETNNAVYCDRIRDLLNRDDEHTKAGVVVVATTNLDHCAKLEKLLHEQFVQDLDASREKMQQKHNFPAK
jgi:hypothetical protein